MTAFIRKEGGETTVLQEKLKGVHSYEAKNYRVPTIQEFYQGFAYHSRAKAKGKGRPGLSWRTALGEE